MGYGSSPAVKSEPTTSSLPAARQKPSPAPRGLAVKHEPTEPLIPQKRASDAATHVAGVKAEDGHSHTPLALVKQPATPPLKRAKSELSKTPLGSINSNTGALIQPKVDNPPPLPAMTVEQAQIRYDEVQRKLGLKEAAFEVLRLKGRKTQADRTKFGMLSKDIDKLLIQRAECFAALASARDRQMAYIAPTFGNIQLPPPFHNPAFPTFQDRKPVIQQAPAIASGSNVRLPTVPIPNPFHVKMDMDDDESDDEEMMFPQPIIPLAGDVDERFDDQGNFYGRGRDRFVGPQANAEEYAFVCLYFSMFSNAGFSIASTSS